MLKDSSRSLGVIALVACVLLIAALSIFYLYGDGLNTYFMQGKMFHETSATVVKKECIVFDEENHRYKTDDFGNVIDANSGEVQWRVYFEIDTFDQIREPVRDQLLESERRRVAEGRVRFWFKSKEWFDSIKIGDKLTVGYRPVNGGGIEIANVDKKETNR